MSETKSKMPVGVEAVEGIADIMEPATAIMADEEIQELAKEDTVLNTLKVALKKYPKEILTVLAIVEGENPDTYEPSLLHIPAMLITLANDPDVKVLFTSQGQKLDENASGSATESTKETDKK